MGERQVVPFHRIIVFSAPYPIPFDERDKVDPGEDFRRISSVASGSAGTGNFSIEKSGSDQSSIDPDFLASSSKLQLLASAGLLRKLS